MPVKIRLTRVGKKKQPSYRVVVVDSRKPRDGAYIEQIGRYDPRAEPSLVEIDNERALDWLQKGAQPTERAQKLLEISGAWTRFRIDKGDIHTIGETPAVEPKAVDAEVEEPKVEEVVEAKAEEPAPEAVAEVEEPAAEEPAAEADVEKEDE
jgi:small subunit ribosomal protein S16